ncbi:Fc.00g056620.m01.CDS01 [Cosmosporella sp. VM-42]
MNSQLDGPVPLWIDNEAVHSDIIFSVTNHGTQTSTLAFGCSPDLARQAVQSSSQAFVTWRGTTPWKRRELLMNAARLLDERRSVAASILNVEIPIDDFTIQQINIQGSIDLLIELASQIHETTSSTLLPSKIDGSIIALVTKEPQGVQVGIAPWNVSLLLGLRAVATPIACGNTAILKASETTPLVHNFIGRLFKDAGFPPGVLNVIQHRKEDAPAILDILIEDDCVRKLNFTGSAAVGKIIAAKAAQKCKPVLLELGGKAPQIVLHDADLEQAAEAAIAGAFTHHGQICMSTERIIVHASVMDQFAAKLRDLSSKLHIQPGASADHVSRVGKLIEKAIDDGAEPLSGLTVEIKVTRNMAIWHEETFAPIALLVPFSTNQEAVELANDSVYGLSASIFTRNIAQGMKLARHLEAGAVHINSMTIHDEAHLPHGGVKDSGWGRFGVPWAFSEFTHLKTITVRDHR